MNRFLRIKLIDFGLNEFLSGFKTVDPKNALLKLMRFYLNIHKFCKLDQCEIPAQFRGGEIVHYQNLLDFELKYK